MTDETNPVVALCVKGMSVDGAPAEARRLFEEAWAAHRDDYEAAIAAHYVARHQPTAADALHWNAVALSHARADVTGRSVAFMPSLYLNLADSRANVGEIDEARAVIKLASASLNAVPRGPYHAFVAHAVRRLAERLGVPSDIVDV